MSTVLNFVCDRLPDPDGCRFIELENDRGEIVGEDVGVWHHRDDGLVELRVELSQPPIIQTLHDNADLIALQATVTQQAKMIEHLRGGPTPLYTAVDMANAARDGFRDGVDSFKIRGEVLMEIFHDGGPEPFVCAIHGCICLEQVEAAQKDFRENMPDELDRGEGIYTFSFYYDRGQYDGYGRCEIAAGWGFDFVSFKAFEDQEVSA